MKNQTLSMEQMNILISKGVDISKASMRYERTRYWSSGGHYGKGSWSTWRDWRLCIGGQINEKDESIEATPIFTVTDMMEMLPIRINNKEYPDGDKFNLGIQRLLFDNDNWLLSFILGDVVEYDCKGSLKDIAYETILWLLDNNHKLNNQT